MKWSRRKDRYIGRLCSDTGSVSGGFGHLPECRGGYRNPSGSILGLMGLSGRRGGAARAAARPSPSSPNWTRKGGRRPLSFPLSPSLPFPLLLQLGKEGVLLPVGVGLPPWRALLLGRPPLPPCSFIYEGRGTLETQQLIS